MKLLHLGCGRKGRDFGECSEPAEVITLDAEAHLSPDIVCTLGRDPIPLPDNSIDAAVAVHVLEHIGRQGETAEWFHFWEELYRVLRPDGELHFTSPMWSSVWCWADPQHVRALSPQAFVFFAQDSYRVPDSAISPYKIRCDFEPSVRFESIPGASSEEESFRGVLKAIKPLKPWWEDVP